MEVKTTFQKLTDEIKEKISEQLKSKEVQDFVAKIKEAQESDTGKFEMIISTGDEDRAGEIVDVKGWDLEFYKLNPIVLWAHNYSDLPIGITESIEVKDGKLMATGKFASQEANPFAQQVRKLYEEGMLKTASVGFIPKEMNGNVISKAELLEWSFVPVPCNPYALSTLSKAGIDTEALMTKGIIIKEEPKEGDECKLDDETIGVLKPDGDGKLVCTPKEQKPNNDEPAPEPDNNLAVKIGAELTQMQNTIDTAIVDANKRIVDLLSKKNIALDKKSQGGEPKDGLNKGREPAGLNELEEFLYFRQILQTVDKVIEDGLRRTREKIRDLKN